MSKQPNKIDLDFFKTEFEEKSQLDHGWNAPPDFIFEDAIEVVNRRKKRKKNSFLYLASFGFILVAVILSQVYANNKVKNLEERIDLLTTTKTTAPAIIKNKKNTVTETEQLAPVSSVDNKIVATRKSIPTTSSRMTTRTEVSRITSTTQPTSLFNSRISIAQKSIANSTKNLSIVADNNNSNPIQPLLGTTPAVINSKTVLTPSLSSLGPKPLSLTRKPLSLQPTLEKSKIDKRVLYLRFLINRNSSSLKMSGPAPTHQTLTKYDAYYSGYGFQTQISVPLSSRFSITGTAAFNKYHNQSATNFSASYKKSNEKEMTSGMTMYETMMALESPVGTLDHQMQFEVNPLITREGDLITENSVLDQCLSITSFSGGVEYRLIQNATFHWSTSIGIGANYINNIKSELNSEYLMHNKSMGKSYATMDEVKNLNAFYSSIELGTLGAISFGEKYQLSLGLGFSRSLSSLRNNSNGGASTYIVNWNSSIGLTRAF